jgi:hypothetical protein
MVRGFPVSEFPRLNAATGDQVVLGAAELAEAVRQALERHPGTIPDRC